MGRHVTALGHIILITSQPVFALSPECCVLSGEARNIKFIVFWFDGAQTHDLTTLETSTLAITPPMRVPTVVILYTFLYNYKQASSGGIPIYNGGRAAL
jgi:hypothetical protein